MSKPVIKWAGGKRNIMPLLTKLFTEKATGNNTFFDGFGGGGSVSIEMAKYFPRVIYNEKNIEITSMYEVIRDNPYELIMLLKEAEKNNSKEYFLKIRAWDRHQHFSSIDKISKAMRTIYMNKVCFNGLYRVNLKGQFNVPYGRYKKPNICDENNILELSKLFRTKIQIVCEDFWTAIQSQVAPGDVVYFDPPYDRINSDSFIEYNNDRFGEQEQNRLKLYMNELTDEGVFVVQSNSSTPRMRFYYEQYIDKMSYISVRRMVGANTNSRQPIEELLFHNFEVINKNENKN
jgi:DNA adenine methylase